LHKRTMVLRVGVDSEASVPKRFVYSEAGRQAMLRWLRWRSEQCGFRTWRRGWTARWCGVGGTSAKS